MGLRKRLENEGFKKLSYEYRTLSTDAVNQVQTLKPEKIGKYISERHFYINVVN